MVPYRCIFLVALFGSLAGANDITPRIGAIEIYGARKVPVQKIKTAIQAEPGGFLPSREDAEERIDKISGVVGSRVEAACCENKNMILYVGVEERDAPHIDFNPPPTEDIALPRSLLDSYHTFLDEVAGSIRGRNADEDLTQGYSLMADPACRKFQQSFLVTVAADLPTVDRTLRESADPEQRAASAYLLQYGPRGPHTTKTIVDGLQYGLRDRDDAVRENAVRALKAVAIGAKLHPEEQIRIEPTWFVELLNSVVWSDRHNASLALVNLTDKGNGEAVALIRERALQSVVEMARWRDLQEALPPFILAGRLAGLDDNQIKRAWLSGDREGVLKKALASGGKHAKLSASLRKSQE